MSTGARSLGQDRGLTLAYCAAHFGKSLFWNCGTLLLAFFLTEVAALPPMVMGAVLAGSLLLSGATDVIMGRTMRKQLSCTRSAAMLQVWGCVFASLALLGLFMAPLVSGSARTGWVLATLLAFRVAYSVYDTPQNALMTLATADAWSRSRVAALRVATSGMAALLLAAAILPFLASDAFSGVERSADAASRSALGGDPDSLTRGRRPDRRRGSGCGLRRVGLDRAGHDHRRPEVSV